MNTITLTLTLKQIEKLKNTFKDNIVNKEIPYVNFQLKLENCTITVYTTNKVVFQGNDANIYASAFNDNIFINQAGSDEVGTGDYFGPITVCACIVNENNYNKIKDLNIQDSKALTDDFILDIAPTLMELLPYSLLIVDNKKYNQIHSNYNLNKIKALLHNQAYINLNKKQKLPSLLIVDQFTKEHNYFNYLKYEKEIIKNIHFETKAESKYISVACASIIARYAFLKKWEEMENKYNFKFTKGASSKVDNDGVKFIKQFGEEQLKNVAKLHFKNTEKIKSIINQQP